MNIHTPYYYFSGALPAETCKKIILMGNEKIKEFGEKSNAHTFGDTEKQARPTSVAAGDMLKSQLREKNIKEYYERDSKVAWFNDQWLYDLILPFVDEANKKSGWNWQWNYSEQFQFTVYEPGGFYTWHADGGSDHHSAFKRYIYGVTDVPLKPDGRLPEGYTDDDGMVGKVRKISLTINLNEPGDYEGGEFKIDLGEGANDNPIITVNEIKPQGSIVVFPSFIRHCVAPVTKGKRYSLVLWTLGYPFK